MRIVALFICLALVGGALFIIGPALYLDNNSLQIVLGGGIGYALLKGSREPFIKLFGDSAVYFGWIGSLIGLIAITGGRFDTWEDVEKMGPALAVAMLTLFCGYMAPLIAMTFTPLTSS
jgi:hypothetical protein